MRASKEKCPGVRIRKRANTVRENRSFSSGHTRTVRNERVSIMRDSTINTTDQSFRSLALRTDVAGLKLTVCFLSTLVFITSETKIITS